MDSAPGKVTQLLLAWGDGDSTALDRLIPFVYQELHRLASRHLRRERPAHTLQTTALVHEAYLRLVDQKRAQWQNRVQFYAVAAEAMRRVLVDYARRRKYAKRGRGIPAVSLDEAAAVTKERAEEGVALDDALKSLAKIDARKSQIVELRYFGALRLEETAEALGVAPGPVKRDWTLAKAWLRREMSAEHLTSNEA